MSTHNFEVSIMILSFRTYRSGQTVQTQIGLEQSSLFAIPSASFLEAFLCCKANCWNFRVITAIFWVSENLGVFR